VVFLNVRTNPTESGSTDLHERLGRLRELQNGTNAAIAAADEREKVNRETAETIVPTPPKTDDLSSLARMLGHSPKTQANQSP
jgi:hypothetical protein